LFFAVVDSWRVRCRASKSSEFVLEGRIIGFTCSSQQSSRAGSYTEGREGDEGESIKLDTVKVEVEMSVEG
jgi:hypothetical protein